MNSSPLPRVSDEQQLTELLSAHGVDTARWATGAAKTVGHLLAELTAGEAQLSLTDDGRVLRFAEGATVNVYARDPHDGRQLWLYEHHQEFIDGRVRTRELPGSIGEKMIPGETPVQAAARALSEELGITVDVPLSEGVLHYKTAESESYPGLLTQYDFWHFDAHLPAEAFNADGYVEVQKDKSTVFAWRAVS